MRELNVVISGFDHYDGVEVNPAGEVPKAIAEQGLGVSSAPDDPLEQVAVTVHAVSIPVSFAKAWPTQQETIAATTPNIVIATGHPAGREQARRGQRDPTPRTHRSQWPGRLLDPPAVALDPE